MSCVFYHCDNVYIFHLCILALLAYSYTDKPDAYLNKIIFKNLFLKKLCRKSMNALLPNYTYVICIISQSSLWKIRQPAL